jgi:hypothetical protein
LITFILDGKPTITFASELRYFALSKRYGRI